MTTQTRLIKKLRGDLQSGATVCVTRTNDPWVKQLNAQARITTDPITQSTPPSVTAHNNVSIVSQEASLSSETLIVTADVSEIP